MPNITPFLIALLCVLPNNRLLAEECSAKSGKQVLPLLELYTSEGCSSCPPADLWLSNLQFKDSTLTPLAFHVDYWDYIGWKDRFAKASFSERQRKSAAQGGLGFVYTPQFMLNGKDFRNWNEARLTQSATHIRQQVAKIDLSLNIQNKTHGDIIVRTTAQTISATEGEHTDIYLALYENKLSSTITAGENMGRTLNHDYVVRELLGPYPLDAKNQLNKTFILKPEWKTRNAGTVVFAQNRRSGEILQSLGLTLCH